METLDVFLLGGSYRTVGPDVAVELYGRTSTGEAIVARYYGFRPYFEVLDPTDDLRSRLKADSEIVDQSDVRLWSGGVPDRPVLKVTLHSPWRVPEYRERYRRDGPTPNVIACDIPFFHRFLYDKGLGLTVRFEAEPEDPEIAKIYTVPRVVKIVTDAAHDIRPAPPFRPALTVLSFDIENAIRERTIFTICGVVDRGQGALGSFQISAENERDILVEFLNVIEREDPDVITGYNIGGYDIPLLIERAQALKVSPFSMARDRGEPKDAGERLWRLSGRVIADAWWSARKELRPKQESLQFVARTLLGEGKLDVDRRNIAAEWTKDRAKVMQYCEKDAELALRILQRLRTLEKAEDLATVAHLPLEEGLNGRTSLFIDAILIPRADRRGIGVPPSQRAKRENPIEGGYVHEIRPGIYRWVVVLDFKSMYPSIIIAKNLCFTTLSPDGTTVSPSGAKFLTPDIRAGLIPELLRELLADRDRFRRLGREAVTPELQSYYDGLQNAVKILMNSFYGVLASSFYRFTDKEIGAAITSFAREAITSIIKSLESEGFHVVYSDTDSVFVSSPDPSLEGAKRFGEELSKRFTAAGITFEFQSIYESLFSHGAKKRYVGRTVFPKEELVIRGYETRRTDAFDFQSEALLEVFDLVLKGDTERAIARSRELVQTCREGKVPVERLVVARSVRPEEQYNEATREALPFLRVFKQLKAEGYDVIPGMKVAWIVTDAGKTPQDVEPWIDGRPFLKTPDFEYYADRVAQTLARVTEVFDWDAAALLKGRRTNQHKLGEDAGAPPRATLSAAPPATLSTPVTALDDRRGKRRQSTL